MRFESVRQLNTPMKKIPQYITQHDIAENLYLRKRHWFHGDPTVTVVGEEKKFGRLIFDFKDEVVSYDVYLYDKKWIESVAKATIKNFSVIDLEEDLQVKMAYLKFDGVKYYWIEDPEERARLDEIDACQNSPS